MDTFLFKNYFQNDLLIEVLAVKYECDHYVAVNKNQNRLKTQFYAFLESICVDQHTIEGPPVCGIA